METGTGSKTTLSLSSTKQTIRKALAEMALNRGASPSTEIIRGYVDRLAEEKLCDVLAALGTIQDMPRREGELAFPERGAILAVVHAEKIARQNRNQNTYYQQQVCPGCKSVVQMQRPRGEQFRTWCLPCQAYRKIVPEDLALTSAEWAKLCAELDLIYREWVRRGMNPKECVDPQFDRANVQKEAGDAYWNQ